MTKMEDGRNYKFVVAGESGLGLNDVSFLSLTVHKSDEHCNYLCKPLFQNNSKGKFRERV